MIFIGDIAHPFSKKPDWSTLSDIAKDTFTVANFEGPLNANLSLLDKSILYNHPSVIQNLLDVNTGIVSLANNHITDIENGIDFTRSELKKSEILSVGAGHSPDEAAASVLITENCTDFVFLAFGWPTIHCQPASKGRAGTNPLSPKHVFESIKRTRQEHPEAYLILLMHWNYELELYPQPADRQLAFSAIELGVNAVIGHHPHCIGGIETYKNAIIAYSLGNWWLPQNVFFAGELNYPSHTREQMALEWTPGEMPKIHWFDYDERKQIVTFQDSTKLHNCKRISKLTPFAGMDFITYKNWFKKNRVKRKLLPIYQDYNNRVQNKIFDIFVHFRHIALMRLKKILDLIDR